MFEAKLSDAVIIKRLLESIKELVTDANFDCDEEGLKLQAMDNSHVALVGVKMTPDAFIKYRCDRPMALGVNLGSLSKVLKCAKDDDLCSLHADDDADVLRLTYEAKNSDRIAEYDMKLMDIDSDKLGIPDTEYDARVTMPAAEFARICRDLTQLGESVRIEVSKEGVRFASDGDSANGSVLLKQTEAARRKYASYRQGEAEGEGEDGEGSGETEEGEGEAKVKKEVKDDDEVMEDADEKQGEFNAKSDDEGEDEKPDNEEDEEEQTSKKNKRKRPAPQANGTSTKRPKKSQEDESAGGVSIEMNQSVSLTFSLKYLVNFSKSTSLSNTVQLMMSSDVPLLVAYRFEQGHIHYYLAPKIGDE